MKLNVPIAPVGVPVIIPVWLRASVSGKEVPPPNAHVRLPAPPLAASLKLYGPPRVAAVIAPVVATVGEGETATMVVPEFVVPVSFAVTVTEAEGAVLGAVNVAGAPLAVCTVIVPQFPPPQVSAQSKPRLPASLFTVAVIGTLWFTSKARAALGLRVITGGGGGSVEVPPHPLKKHIAKMETKRDTGFFMRPL